MAKEKKSLIPHHIRERVRHQKLLQLLNENADKVPNPYSIKKETKDMKLRRIILYIRFLQKKKNQLNYFPHRNGHAQSKDLRNCTVEKLSGEVLKIPHLPARLRRKAQIIFLKKSCPPIEIKPEFDLQEKENCSSILNKDIKNIDSVKNDSFKIFNKFNAIGGSDESCVQTENIYTYEPSPYADEDVKYIPNGMYQYFQTEESQVNLNTNWDHGLQKKSMSQDSANNLLHKDTFVSMENTQKNHSNHLNTNLSPVYINSMGKDLQVEEGSSKAVLYNYSQYYNGMKEFLPPVSVFRSKIADSLIVEKEKKNSSICISPYKTKESPVQFKDYLMDAPIAGDGKSLIKEHFPNDNVYSENSPGTSTVINSSNEWVSDDTLTDSGSLNISSSWESTISTNCMETSPPSVPSNRFDLSCDMHFFPHKKFHDLYSHNCFNHECNRKSAIGKCNEGCRKYNMIDFAQNKYPTSYFSQKSCEKNHVLPSMYPFQNVSQIPFIVQKKRYNEDNYMPQSVYEIESTTHEIESTSSYCEIMSNNCFSDHQIKKEIDNSPLPEHEMSYSFKNFSQWCPDGYNDME